MTDTSYSKPEPTPLPAPGTEPTAEGLAEKLFAAWAAYWKSGDKVRLQDGKLVSA